MKSLHKSGGSGSEHSALTSHGVIILATGAVILLAWKATGGNGVITSVFGIILLVLVLKNYGTIISQIEGV